ncbi:MAG: hypothetical protein QM757_03785 [Paludibaculum sp.]
MLRKFSDGEFCTAEHRQIFQQQQSDLALARLIESQNRIERPAAPKPAPKPAPRPKQVAGEPEKAVPEARPIAEWFKPNGRKVLFVPLAPPFEPKMSSALPGANVSLQQRGFVAPGGLRLTYAVPALARSNRQAVLNPLFRLGLRLPIGAKPIQPGLEPKAAGLEPLPGETGLSGVAVLHATPADHLNSAGAACIPVLFFGTVAPDRQDALAPEPIAFADALFPLVCPIAGPVPARTVSEVALSAAHPVQRLAAIPGIAAERAAEPEAEPLPVSEVLFAVALPGVEHGLVCAIAIPPFDLPYAFEAWGPEASPEGPAVPPYRLVAVLREESGLATVELPGLQAIAALRLEAVLTTLCVELDPELPFWYPSLAEPVMAGCKRTARMKLKAVPGTGSGIGQVPFEALASERTPGAPGGFVVLGKANLAGAENLLPVAPGSVLNAAPAIPSEVAWVESLESASTLCVPSGELRPEIPEPVLVLPEIQESEERLAADETDEPMFVRVVRPLIDDSAPDAMSGWPEDEFARGLSALSAMSELAKTAAAEPEAAEPLSVEPASEAPAVPLAAETLPESVEPAVATEPLQEILHPVEALADLSALAAEVSPLTAEAAPDTAEVEVETETIAAEAAVEALPAEIEPESVAAITALETLDAEAAQPELPATSEPASLTIEAAQEPSVALAEAEPDEAQFTQPVLSVEAVAPEVLASEELAGAEVEQPATVAEEADPPQCDQLQIYAGRGESGAASKPHFSKADDHGLWPDTLAAEPLRPKSRLVIDQADGSGPRRMSAERAGKPSAGLLRFDTRKLPGRRFWAHAPSDLKWVALGLPLILALIVYSFKASPPKSETGRPVADSKSHSVIGSELNSIQKVILDRAAIKLYDDFRGGLGSWHGTEGWAKTWKYGEASFLEPGQLALYSPTVNMRDYTMQFLGQIERRSLNWVFRATDSKNYYAMRIVITRAGPLPQASVVRYAVIDGKEVGMKTLPLPFPVHSDTLYLVKMEVRGDSFTTYIQSQVVDNFTDSRLEGGGIGFFSPKGDKSYLRWVEVTHQYDVLGRLCALLAPYNVQAEGRKTE